MGSVFTTYKNTMAMMVAERRWPTRLGSHHRIWSAFVRLAQSTGVENDAGWLVTISLRNLAEFATVSSKSHLDKVIAWLSEQGLVAVWKSGVPDAHGERGESTTWLVSRNEKGSLPIHSLEVMARKTYGVSYSDLDIFDAGKLRKKMDEMSGPLLVAEGPEHLPPWDVGGDLFVAEPYYALLLDMMHLGLAPTNAMSSPLALAAALGVSRQGASKMLQRWTLGFDGGSDSGSRVAPDLFTPMNIGLWADVVCSTTERRYRLQMVHQREKECREAALSGSWRRKTPHCGRWFGQTKVHRLRPLSPSMKAYRAKNGGYYCSDDLPSLQEYLTAMR